MHNFEHLLVKTFDQIGQQESVITTIAAAAAVHPLSKSPKQWPAAAPRSSSPALISIISCGGRKNPSGIEDEHVRKLNYHLRRPENARRRCSKSCGGVNVAYSRWHQAVEDRSPSGILVAGGLRREGRATDESP
ncbi:hypothetical protein C2S53_014421 [Perilla frutescens var. hirtella]|uniref:Uncharacterized protein n=1 Tax=Perilla frutescens var. hirtella TaxID=608512 RepID=A0AAD4ISC6_PERFH|nr:hypothetical protein C2S53_014421 [Perilla frutescens var. hirtella]